MLRTILIHLDSSERAGHRREVGLALAAAHGARAVGLHVVAPPLIPPGAAEIPMVGAASALEAEMRAATEAENAAAERSRAEFEERAAELGVAAHFSLSDELDRRVLGRYARYADLVVVSQDPPDMIDAGAASDLAADLALGAGRPVLVVPYIGPPAAVGTRILLAWNGSREAARAAADALPFLARAAEVTVLGVGDDAPVEDDPEPGVDIRAWLARHEVRADVQRRVTELDVGDELLSRAADRGCDLLVMGVYGHSRFREMVFGGATRHILRHMTLPVLLSH